jgi:hypothetical protein
MKAKFNYDLTEVYLLLEKVGATSKIDSHHEVTAGRDALLQKAESLVHQMEERAHQAAQSQTAHLDYEKVRRLLRKI